VNFVHKFILSLPIIFFSLAALARLHFIPHLEMKTCNVLYQLHLCIFMGFFGGSLSLTDSFQNSLETRINCTKLRIQWSKNCLRGWGGAEKEGRRENVGKSAMVVGGIDAPASE